MRRDGALLLSRWNRFFRLISNVALLSLLVVLQSHSLDLGDAEELKELRDLSRGSFPVGPNPSELLCCYRNVDPLT